MERPRLRVRCEVQRAASTEEIMLMYDEWVASLVEPSTRHQVTNRLREALPLSCDALLAGLVNGVPSVRRWCALVLDHAPHDQRIEEALRQATKDRNRKVRRAALHALACAHCKPDGCLTTDGVAFLVEGLLHDRSLALRRNCAGGLMWGHDENKQVIEAFRQVLLDDTDAVLRERAAISLASRDVPREGREHSDWAHEWQQRIQELLAS